MQKLLALAAAVLVALPASAQPGLSESARLAAAYDAVLAARFDQARAELARACPPAPAEACAVLSTAALWWQIQLNPNDRALDSRLQTEAARAIEAARAWTEREPRRAEAWLYLAGAHGPLEQLRVLRGEKLAAARDGVRLKGMLDQALALDAALEDARFGIGVYHYVAGVQPAAVKVLRWLLFLPGGDRVEGLREMLQARDRAVLLRWEGYYQLHWLYVWYEHAPEQAIEMLRTLDARYPSNPLFLQRVAEIQRDSMHDHAASMETWRTLLERATARRVEFAELTDVRARIGLAQELVALAQAERATEVLAPVIARRPAAPYGANARAHLVLGNAHARLGESDRALIAFRAAIAAAPSDDPDDIRSQARDAIARRRDRK